MSAASPSNSNPLPSSSTLQDNKTPPSKRGRYSGPNPHNKGHPQNSCGKQHSAAGTNAKVQAVKTSSSITPERNATPPPKEQASVLDSAEVSLKEPDKKMEAIAAPILVEQYAPDAGQLKTSESSSEKSSVSLEPFQSSICEKKSKKSDVDAFPYNAGLSIDPALYEEQQTKISALSLEKQTALAELHATSSTLQTLQTDIDKMTRENKKLKHMVSQAKLDAYNVESLWRQFGPPSSQEGFADLDAGISRLTRQFRPAKELSANSEKEPNIPSKSDIIALFDAVAMLKERTSTAVDSLETKDKRDPLQIFSCFMQYLDKAKNLVILCRDLKVRLVDDIESIQKKIIKDVAPSYSKEQCKGVETISKFYSEKRFEKDIARHAHQHNDMRSDLKEVVSHYEKTVLMLNHVIHHIDVALIEYKSSDKDETIAVISGILDGLPLDIQSITIPEVKESVIQEAFTYVRRALMDFREMTRDTRKEEMGIAPPEDEALLADHLRWLGRLVEIQKKHLQELDKFWNGIRLHVDRRIEELELIVAQGNCNIDLEKTAKQALLTVANIEKCTPEEYKERKILPYKKEYQANKTSLAKLNKRRDKLYEAAELAKQEVHRSHDAFIKKGHWSTETRWGYVDGIVNEEVLTLFKKTTPLQPIEPQSPVQGSPPSSSSGWFGGFLGGGAKT